MNILRPGLASPAPAIVTDDPMITAARRERKPRDMPSRELFAIAAAARDGIPPAGSTAAAQLRQLEESGAWAAAMDLRAEIARDASKLERLARARARQERRGKRRRAQQQAGR